MFVKVKKEGKHFVAGKHAPKPGPGVWYTTEHHNGDRTAVIFVDGQEVERLPVPHGQAAAQAWARAASYL